MLIEQIDAPEIRRSHSFLMLSIKVYWSFYRSNTQSKVQQYITLKKITTALKNINYSSVSEQQALIAADIAHHIDKPTLFIAPAIRLADIKKSSRGRWLLRAAEATEQASQPTKLRAIVNAADRWFAQQTLNSPLFTVAQSEQLIQWMYRYSDQPQRIMQLSRQHLDFSLSSSLKSLDKIRNIYSDTVSTVNDLQHAKHLLDRLPFEIENKTYFERIFKVFVELQALSEAEFTASILLSFEPMNLEYQENFAQILQWQHRYEEALNWWLTIMEQRPTESHFFRVLGLADQLNKTQDISLPLQEAVTHLEISGTTLETLKHPQYWIRLSEIKKSLGAEDESLELLKKGYAEFPDNLVILRELLQALVSLSQYKDSIGLFIDYLHQKPDDVFIRYLFGEVALMLNRQHLALDQFKQVFSSQSLPLTESSVYAMSKLAFLLGYTSFERQTMAYLSSHYSKDEYGWRMFQLIDRDPSLSAFDKAESVYGLIQRFEAQLETQWDANPSPLKTLLLLMLLEYELETDKMLNILRRIANNRIASDRTTNISIANDQSDKAKEFEAYDVSFGLLSQWLDAYDLAEAFYAKQIAVTGDGLPISSLDISHFIESEPERLQGLIGLYIASAQYQKLQDLILEIASDKKGFMQQLIQTREKQDEVLVDIDHRHSLIPLWKSLAWGFEALGEYEQSIYWFQNVVAFSHEKEWVQWSLANGLFALSYWDSADKIRQQAYHSLRLEHPVEQWSILNQQIKLEEQQWLLSRQDEDQNYLDFGDKLHRELGVENRPFHSVLSIQEFIHQGRWEMMQIWLNLYPDFDSYSSQFSVKDTTNILLGFDHLIDIHQKRMNARYSVAEIPSSEIYTASQGQFDIERHLSLGAGEQAWHQLNLVNPHRLNDGERQGWFETLAKFNRIYPHYVRGYLERKKLQLPLFFPSQYLINDSRKLTDQKEKIQAETQGVELAWRYKDLSLFANLDKHVWKSVINKGRVNRAYDIAFGAGQRQQDCLLDGSLGFIDTQSPKRSQSILLGRKSEL